MEPRVKRRAASRNPRKRSPACSSRPGRGGGMVRSSRRRPPSPLRGEEHTSKRTTGCARGLAPPAAPFRSALRACTGGLPAPAGAEAWSARRAGGLLRPSGARNTHPSAPRVALADSLHPWLHPGRPFGPAPQGFPPRRGRRHGPLVAPAASFAPPGRGTHSQAHHGLRSRTRSTRGSIPAGPSGLHRRASRPGRGGGMVRSSRRRPPSPLRGEEHTAKRTTGCARGLAPPVAPSRSALRACTGGLPAPAGAEAWSARRAGAFLGPSGARNTHPSAPRVALADSLHPWLHPGRPFGPAPEGFERATGRQWHPALVVQGPRMTLQPSCTSGSGDEPACARAGGGVSDAARARTPAKGPDAAPCSARARGRMWSWFAGDSRSSSCWW